MAFDPAEFKKTLKYEGVMSPDEIVGDIDAIQQLDKDAEARRSTSGKIGGGSLVLGFVGLLITGATLDSNSDNAPMMFLVCFGLLGVGAAALIYRATQGKFDTQDRRYLLLERLLPLLGADLPPNAKLRVRMDLSSPSEGNKAAGEGEARGWKVKYFEDPWLALSGQFLDGTKFTLEATEKFQKRSKWKTSASGKMKHKSKTKSATLLSLRLAVKEKRYPALARVSDKLESAVQLPKQAMLKRVDASATGLALKVLIKSQWDCPAHGEPPNGVDGRQLVASLFMSAYQVLNLAKAVAKGRPRVV